MNDVVRLHREAMDLADSAADARRRLDQAAFASLSRAAFEKELMAVHLVVDRLELEPTRSVLHRSAASLALDCGETRTAEQLIAAALAGSPPGEIAQELRDLFEMVQFSRHLSLRGISLHPDEFQLSLEGPGVGFGLTRSDHFVSRVRDLETMIYRTAERALGREFREAGRRKQKLVDELELYLSVPRAASFAVTFKLGKSNQLTLPGLDLPRQVIEELLDCIDLLNAGNVPELRRRIPDDSYYRNFVGLAQKIAPDGEVIRSVGFTATTPKGDRAVALSRPKEAVSPLAPAPVTPAVGKRVEVQGILLEADGKSQKMGRIEVVDDQQRTHKVHVPRGMMSDIVKPMFEEAVIVVGFAIGDHIELQTITLAHEPGVA